MTDIAQKLGSAEEKLQEVVRRIVAKFDPERIILFGSRARGDYEPDSDADLLVVMKGVEGVRRKKATEIDLALWGVDLAVDIFVMTPEQVERDRKLVGTLARPVLLEGKLLYERGR